MTRRKAAPTKPARKTAAAKAPATKTPAPTPVTAAQAIPVVVTDWPSELDDTTATNLFEAIENGQTVKQAAEGLGLKGNTVYQWKRRHARFGARLEEAVDIGIDMMADEEIEIADKAHDRDSAAAVREKREARATYRRIKRPQTFNINPFKAGAGAGTGEDVLGIVLVPMKTTQVGAQQPAVLDGVAVRVPPKAIEAAK